MHFVVFRLPKSGLSLGQTAFIFEPEQLYPKRSNPCLKFTQRCNASDTQQN